MTRKRIVTTVVIVIVLLGANSVSRVSELAAGANVLADKAFSISGKSVANSEKEIREWADSVKNGIDLK